MEKVTTVTNLKSKLSAHLKKVKLGEEFLVTERGKPIARLIPFSASNAPDEHVQDLIRTGVVRAPKDSQSAWDFLQGQRLAKSENSVLEALLDERKTGR